MDRISRRSDGIEVRALSSALMVLVFANPACADAEPVPFVLADDSGLATNRTGGLRRPFDILAADMDLDGDPDLLINWHHRAALELYENEGGRFAQINPPGMDRSGLYDNRGVPDLFARSDVIQRRIEASGRAGLYVWHDRNRAGSWRFLWKDDDDEFDGLRVRCESSLRMLEVSGLATSEFEATDGRRLRVSLKKGWGQRTFGIRVDRVATQLVLQVESPTDGAVPTIFVGPQLTPMAPGEVELWKPDPHGMAWVDVEGSREPELFITRGALAGELRPPARPKEDRYYLAVEAGPPRYRRVRKGIVPASYGRGRRVEWVDVDGDGQLDLSISSEKVANSLLVRDAKTGVFHDRAADWGLNLEDAPVQIWGDLNADGHPDLFYLDGNQVHVLQRALPRALPRAVPRVEQGISPSVSLNVMQTQSQIRFEKRSGDTIGLVLPPAVAGHEIIQSTSLQLLDFDNDGDLDLWVLGYGLERKTLLFRNDGKRFVDVSHEMGLDAAKGGRVVVSIDVDNDGFDDVVIFGRRSILLANLRGRRYRAYPFPSHAEVGNVFAATRLDIDGDGRIDLVAVGKMRNLLRNTSDNENGFLNIALMMSGQEPVGALVRVRYSDGTVRAQRYGSANSSPYSQALGSLHFGIRSGVSIQKVGVQWPGDRIEMLYDVPASRTHMSIMR